MKTLIVRPRAGWFLELSAEIAKGELLVTSISNLACRSAVAA
jgi:hypothetical protein